jgi:hypothetical protein
MPVEDRVASLVRRDRGDHVRHAGQRLGRAPDRMVAAEEPDPVALGPEPGRLLRAARGATDFPAAAA